MRPVLATLAIVVTFFVLLLGFVNSVVTHVGPIVTPCQSLALDESYVEGSIGTLVEQGWHSAGDRLYSPEC